MSGDSYVVNVIQMTIALRGSRWEIERVVLNRYVATALV